MNNEQLRKIIYNGQLHQLPASAQSIELTNLVLSLVEQCFGPDYRNAQFELTPDEFFDKTIDVKQRVYSSEAVREATAKLVVQHGFNPDETLLDPARIRFSKHDGDLSPAAAVVYQAHRDTWYANPQAQINWWMPLHDVSEDETFCFYTEYFSRSVKNTSHEFDFETWMREVGFGRSQNSKPGAYPLPTEDFGTNTPPEKFSLKQAEVLLFSGAHLHQTLPNRSGKTRLSVDFRTVNRLDMARNIGAPNVDNHSRGSAALSYMSLAEEHGK